MQADAVRQIEQTAQKAADVRIVANSPDPRKFWLVQNGEAREYEIPAKPRRHRLYSLRDLVDVAKHYNISAGQTDGISFWIHPAGVTAILNDYDDRQSRADFPLSFTPTWQLLEQFASGASYDQLGLIRLFRVPLADACPQATEIIARIRKVRFNASQSMEADIQRGRESIGREIEAELAQADQIPERVVLLARPFVELGNDEQLEEIECLLEIDVHKQLFHLVPKPGRMEEVLDMEMQAVAFELQKLLEDDPELDVPVFYGEP